MDKINVAVLGATGMVGQRFIQLLENHPFFELNELAASERSVGKKYSHAARWYLEGNIPDRIKDMEVKLIDPEKLKADIVFSALPSGVAREIEPRFAEAGFMVCSNAGAYRMGEDIPLLIPEVNPEHIDMIEVQQDSRGWDGAIITNPNCSTVMITLPFKPIYDSFGISRVFVSTMQALSGAGYNGVPSMAIVDNLIPFIKGEEDKVETEVLKILGKFNGSSIEFADIKLSAHCNRVGVIDGHTETVSLETQEKVDIEEIKKALRDFTGEPQRLRLPTAPERPVIVREEQDRPQPRLDRDALGGMAVTVGRVRKDPILDVKFVALGHNTIRGAAGASVLNAELLVNKKKV
ncbi:aspartate-semialdehyde dehydrogenase 2 [archaeon]|nr:aspartate-semialdehyde dehydrogenase 2 [archaeon]